MWVKPHQNDPSPSSGLDNGQALPGFGEVVFIGQNKLNNDFTHLTDPKKDREIENACVRSRETERADLQKKLKL